MFFSPIGMKVNVQHLASIKAIYINKEDRLLAIKQKVAEAFHLNFENITLKIGDQTLNVDHKTAEELNLTENTTLIVKYTTKIEGATKGNSIASLLDNQGVKSMLKNPQTIKMMKGFFKKEDENSEENETMRMMMNSEGLEDEIEKMTQGGDYMKTQLRNVDLAMAKLENMPGGMNMMSSMMKDVGDPLKMLKGNSSFNEGYSMTENQKEHISVNGKNINYELLYRKQMKELQKNGFSIKEDNLNALKQTGGNLDMAIMSLLEKYDN
ncbi:hypothetical protein EHP00_1388 [Ecytonucleospora hepatopenaei]|uniref:UBA domain-containing protein n=1 Tax=Ecytonucleospora hepatopenaei TaxID=646526 RepID=A0A1W0E8W3_9MICR|nr:hypothetical protein EHP00_1388 [Ecytonucleospora hepatopenaei]